jgi:hypothetical protein
VGKFEVGKFEVGKFEVGKFEVGKFEVGKFEVKTKTFFVSIIAYYDIKIIPCQIMYFCNMRFN